MEAYEHFHLVGQALWRWFVTRCYDSLLVGLLWFVGLWYLHIRWALLWGILAGLLHFIPHLGIVVALIGPAITARDHRRLDAFPVRPDSLRRHCSGRFAPHSALAHERNRACAVLDFAGRAHRARLAV